MYVDPNVISYINRCSEDSRKVRPVPPADRSGKHREQSEQKAANASRRAAHHNGRPLEDEYESSEQEGYTGYGGSPSEYQGSREQKPKTDSGIPKDPQIEKRLRQAYGVSEDTHPVDSFDTAA